jgi:hypothetical protein
VAEHNINLGHHTEDTIILAMKSRCMELIREVTEIELHPDNMIREEGFLLSKLWKLLVQTLKE